MTTSTFSDIIIAPDKTGTSRAYSAAGYPAKKVLYKIDGEAVTEAVTFPYHDFLLLRTKSGDHLRDASNQPLEDENWSDYYFEPFTSSLYRRDERGNWYDLEGFRLASPVFLKGDVLISLKGKVSRQSWAFRDQQVVVSPNVRLIQVGKMVFNPALEVVRFFGEKITGLGRTHITFGGEDQWQEVMRGIGERAFLNEFTGAPLLINDEEIVGHVGGVTRGPRHFEVFRSATRDYVLENSSTGDIRYEGQPLGVDLDTYLVINGHEVVSASDGRRSFYFDLDTKAPYQIPETGKELITKISIDPVRLEGTDLHNISTAHRSLVYDMTAQQPFRMGEVAPTAVYRAPGYEDFYFFAKVDGKRRLCDKDSRNIIRLGERQETIAKITGEKGSKLLNAITGSGELVVLDVRQGLRTPRLAAVGDRYLRRILGKSHRIGDRVLQHVELDSLGGLESRVVDLETEPLELFTLPKDLTVYPDQPQPSCFAGNPIIQVDFRDEVNVHGNEFLMARFLSDMGDERTVLLQAGNARPLHLDGARHRNELITGFRQQDVRRPYNLGEHRMVGVYTLNEELEEGGFLVSVDKLKSWLPFYDSFLPVFRRAIPIPELASWECVLFEVLGPAGTGEYVAVEKNKPHRVLARKSRKKVEPRIITSKTMVLTDPDEMSAIGKFFLDPGMLVEVT